MTVFLNGRFVPEAQAVVSVFDRGFLYGDGLFETLRVTNGAPFRWNQHLSRLQQGLEFLRISLPYDPSQLLNFAHQLTAANQMADSLLRLTISRGVGKRGYSPAGADSPSVVISLHTPPTAPPEGLKLTTSSVRLPVGEPLAQYKTCSKLPQIMASLEADSMGADEALLLNSDGHVVEGSSSNLFWIERDRVCTPPIPAGILPGVTRAIVFELCVQLGVQTCESSLPSEELSRSDGIFLSRTSLGIVPASSLDRQSLARSPLIAQLSAAYLDLLQRETSLSARREAQK